MGVIIITGAQGSGKTRMAHKIATSYPKSSKQYHRWPNMQPLSPAAKLIVIDECEGDKAIELVNEYLLGQTVIPDFIFIFQDFDKSKIECEDCYELIEL